MIIPTVLSMGTQPFSSSFVTGTVMRVSICLLFLLLAPSGLVAGQGQSIGVDDHAAKNPHIQLTQRGSAPPMDVPPILPPMPRQTPVGQTPASPAPPPVIFPPEIDPSAMFPAQPTPTGPEPSSAPPAATAIKEITTWGVKMGLVSLNFDDADIYSVIQTVFALILW